MFSYIPCTDKFLSPFSASIRNASQKEVCAANKLPLVAALWPIGAILNLFPAGGGVAAPAQFSPVHHHPVIPSSLTPTTRCHFNPAPL